MSDLAVTVSQITPVLEKLLGEAEDGSDHPPALVLIRGELDGGADPTLNVNGQVVDLLASSSPLEIRAAAVAKRQRPLAVVTPCEQSSLGLDLLARTLGRKVRAVDRWATVAGLFGADVPSKRLARHRPLADLLIEEAAAGATFSPARSRVLDYDTAVAAASRALIDQELENLLQLLVWAETPSAQMTVRRLSGKEEVLDQLRDHHVSELGPGAAVVHAALQQQFDRPLTGAALAAHALLDQPDPQTPAIRSVENLFGNPDLTLDAYRHLGRVAVKRTVDEADGPDPNAWISTADRLLANWGWDNEAWRSPVSRIGYDQRLARAAEALTVWRQQPDDRDLEAAAERAVDDVAEHRESQAATSDPRRLERLRMAGRVVRRGGFELPDTGTLAETLRRYRSDGAWLDRARGLLAQGDESPDLDQLYRTITDEADTTRDRQSPAIGRILTQAAMPAGDGVIGIEDVIDQVIGPLTTTVPVLVAVLDGMGWPSFLEVDRTLSRSGWVPVVDADGRAAQSVVAVLPTVTEFSRTSLFSGALTKGDARTESRNFAAHRALTATSHRHHPPVIFHKKSLAGDGGIDSLPKEARDAIGDPNQRVVAVVINNIDERLKEVANPLAGWNLDALAPLGSLLQQARESGRALVITADHGHVLERRTEYKAGVGGERWRTPGDEPPTDEEILVSGPRVLGNDDHTVVMPVIEQVRYSNARRHGYHGGLTLPEVAVPLAIYTAEVDGIDGWEPTSFTPPTWWHPAPHDETTGSSTTAPTAAPTRAKPKKPKPTPADQAQLFETPKSPAEANDELAADQAAGTSPVAPILSEAIVVDLIAQHRLDPQQVATTLTQLDRYGTTAVGLDRLADQIGYPRMRMRRLLTQLQRVTNVDGYGVLEITGDEVRFDRALLERQLGLS